MPGSQSILHPNSRQHPGCRDNFWGVGGLAHQLAHPPVNTRVRTLRLAARFTHSATQSQSVALLQGL
eukprot:scaffold152382_cov29-Tisochrysis_lutea.AAC.4